MAGPVGDEPRRVSGVTGRVSRGPFGGASKSRHVALWIDTGSERWVLRRRHGPAMGDRTLARYVGHDVRCSGTLLAHTLLADEIEIIG
ncbi:hypothetical protein BURK1_03341 [Burkholderiales bacterium]|nr:hypothetical protein BURK1_03341 [Burkholderiales bacterium]